MEAFEDCMPGDSTHQLSTHDKACVLDGALVAFWFETPDCLLPIMPTVVAYPKFVQRRAKLVMSFEDGPDSPMEGRIQELEK